MDALKGYRTVIINVVVVLVAGGCFLLDIFDKGTASGLIMAALANIGLRTQTSTPLGRDY